MNTERRTFIIAEAGVNHNGSLTLAKRLVDAARDAGADAVKFQTFHTDQLVTRGAAQAPYQRRRAAKTGSQFAMLSRLELSGSDFKSLSQYAAKRAIMFLSTPFDIASAEMLDRLHVPMFKVSSGDLTNHPFLRSLALMKKPLLLSTGMATLKEVESALSVVDAAGNTAVTLLHCVTAYPAPPGEINLRAMDALRVTFGKPVGYSDHTLGIDIAVAAVAAGATVIEKHLTLDTKMKGPDHKASLNPREFARMVRAIRKVERALGDGIKRPAACEIKNIPAARKSIVARKRIRKGELYTSENITVKRPGTGMSPEMWDNVIGTPAPRDVLPDEVILP